LIDGTNVVDDAIARWLKPQQKVCGLQSADAKSYQPAFASIPITKYPFRVSLPSLQDKSMIQEEQVQQADIQEVNYSKADWVIFLVSFMTMLALLQWESRFFWLALPFAITYLVKSLKMM